ncbi:hypothetical protein SK128_021203, partial [Halocaridina rubra]
MSFTPSDQRTFVKVIKHPLGTSFATLKNRTQKKDNNHGMSSGSDHYSLNRRKSLSVSDISSFVGTSSSSRQLVPENELSRQSKSVQSSQSSFLGSPAGKDSRSMGGSIGDLMNSGEFRSTGVNWSPRTCSPITLSMVSVTDKKSNESLYPHAVAHQNLPKQTGVDLDASGDHPQKYMPTSDETDGGLSAYDYDLTSTFGTCCEQVLQAREVNNLLLETFPFETFESDDVWRQHQDSLCQSYHSDSLQGKNGSSPLYLEHKVTIAVDPPGQQQRWDHPSAMIPNVSFDHCQIRNVPRQGYVPGAVLGESDSQGIWKDSTRESKRMPMAERIQLLAHLIHDQHQRVSKDVAFDM